MFASVLRSSAAAAAASSSSARGSSSTSDRAPPPYSYSLPSPSYDSASDSAAAASASPAAAVDALSTEMPSCYAPNPNLVDFSQPAAASASAAVDVASSSQSSQSPLPASYSPSSTPAPAALLSSDAPSVRIYPAFNDLYRHQPNTPDTAQLLALHHQSASSSPALTRAGYPPEAAAYRQFRQPLLHQLPQMSSSAPAGSSSFSTFLSSSPSVSVVSASAPDVYPFLSSTPAPVSYTYSYLQQGGAHQPPVPSVSSAAFVSAASMSSLPATSRTAFSPPVCDSVHLASFQMQAEEERWLMAEARKAEERRRQAEQQRDRERRFKAEQTSSMVDNLAKTFGPLLSPFSAVRPSPPSEPNHGNGLRDSMKGLSLDSRPPSHREPAASPSPASASSPSPRGLLTDQFVYNEQFPGQRFVRHLVTGSDDIVDLAVRFDTTPELIRRHNRRVVFSHLDNVMNEFIHIPVKDSFVLQQQQPASSSASAAGSDDYVVPGAGGLTAEELRLQSEINRQFFAVRSFLSQAARRRSMARASNARAGTVPTVGEAVDPECSEAEAEFYLQESGYNVHAALTAYVEDCEWERKENEKKKAEEASQRQEQERQQRGAGAQRRDGKSYASLALAIAQAKQQRLAALANDANAVQRQQEHVERRLRKRRQLEQKRSSNAAPAASPFSINASQPLRAPLLSQQSSSSSSLLSLSSSRQEQDADVEDLYQPQLSAASSSSFSYHQQNLTPSPAS